MTDTTAPIVILVEPQMAENIGAAARAMLNCGLEQLRLVNPKGGWPNSKAEAMASGADKVLEQSLVFDSLEEATADLERVYATTARRRDMVKHVVTPEGAGRELRQYGANGERCGVVFGRERIGLTNDEVVLADAILHVPLNPQFSSLNLAQAVLLVAYEWSKAGEWSPARILEEAGQRAVSKKELLIFFEHLEQALDAQNFFRVAEKRPSTVRTIRNIFLRADLTGRDVKILHGIVTALLGRRKDQI